MRHGAYQGRRNNNHNNNNNNRHRQNRPNNNGGQPQRPHRNQVLDSNGPESRVRGTAFQINEKYLSLAKDAASSGDLILAENYLQHAEHYQRIINEFEQFEPREQRPRHERSEEGDDENQQVTNEEDNTAVAETTSAPSEEEAEARPVVKKTTRTRRVKAPVAEDNEEDLGLPSSLLG